MTRIRLQHDVAASAEMCFDLARNVDVHIASSTHSRERAVDGVTGGWMGMGDTVVFEARHFGKQWRMTAQITAFESPVFFVDEQVMGPFREWRHEHRFAPTATGCRVSDVVHYVAPFGAIGTLFDWIFLRAYMKRFLARRAKYLKTVAESDTD